MFLLKALLFSVVNGVTTTAEINPRTAADGRHPPFITSFSLPAEHIAWPEGTLLIAGDEPGSAKAAEPTDTDIIGVLNKRVDKDEQSGNVIRHGSVPVEILKCEDAGEIVDATQEQISALFSVGIYV
jgi:hypothetical protein